MSDETRETVGSPAGNVYAALAAALEHEQACHRDYADAPPIMSIFNERLQRWRAAQALVESLRARLPEPEAR